MWGHRERKPRCVERQTREEKQLNVYMEMFFLSILKENNCYRWFSKNE